LPVGTKVGQAFPETALSLRRREALSQAIDIVHDRYWDDLAHLGGEDVSLADLSMMDDLPLAHLPDYTPLLVRQLFVSMTVVAWKLAQPEFLMPATVLEQFGLDALIREAAALLVGEQGSEEDYRNEVEELRDILCFDQDYVALFASERADWFAIAARAREEHGIDILATDFFLDRLLHADSEPHPYCTPPEPETPMSGT
jgi:hypothetical protein